MQAYCVSLALCEMNPWPAWRRPRLHDYVHDTIKLASWVWKVPRLSYVDWAATSCCCSRWFECVSKKKKPLKQNKCSTGHTWEYLGVMFSCKEAWKILIQSLWRPLDIVAEGCQWKVFYHQKLHLGCKCNKLVHLSYLVLYRSSFSSQRHFKVRVQHEIEG